MFSFQIDYLFSDGEKHDQTASVMAYYPTKFLTKHQAFKDLAFNLPGIESLKIVKVVEKLSTVKYKLDVRYIGLSKRLLHCLQMADINFLEQISTWKEKDIVRVRNFGDVCMTELKRVMKDHRIDFYEPPLYKFVPIESNQEGAQA